MQILVLILFILFSVGGSLLKGLKQSKKNTTPEPHDPASPEHTGLPEPQPFRHFKEALDRFLDEEEPAPSQVSSPSHPHPEVSSDFFALTPEQRARVAQRKRNEKQTQKKAEKKLLQEEEGISGNELLFKDGFDLRQAVIYHEIIERKY